MRFWLFHPVIFYPVVIGLSLLVIGISLKPQWMPRPAAAVAGTPDGNSLMLDRNAFNSPFAPSDQYVTVVRDFWGEPRSLRIAGLPRVAAQDQGADGVEIKLRPDAAQMLANKHLIVEINYQPLPVNAAPTLAVSMRGPAPSQWRENSIPPLAGVVRYDFPRMAQVDGIGLRAIHNDTQLAYGVEILSIRITPR